MEVLHDFVVGLTFDDGTVGEVDLLPHLWGPVFEPLRNDPGALRQGLYRRGRRDDRVAQRRRRRAGDALPRVGRCADVLNDAPLRRQAVRSPAASMSGGHGSGQAMTGG